MAKKRSRSRSRSRSRDRKKTKDKGKRGRDGSPKRSDRDRGDRGRSDRDRDRGRDRDRDKKRGRSRSRSRSRSLDRKRRERDRKERDRRDRDKRGSSPRRGDRDRDNRDRDRDHRDRGKQDRASAKDSKGKDQDASKPTKDKPKAAAAGGGGVDLLSKLAAINARVTGKPAVAPAAAAAVLGATGAATASLGAQPAVLAAAALGAPAVSVAQQVPAVVSPVSAEAPGIGAGGGGGGGAKLEASLLANLKKKIKEKAAAPEKLKTTGVAFQAVEEETPPPPTEGSAPSIKLALGKPIGGKPLGGKTLGKKKGGFGFGRKAAGKNKPGTSKKHAGWADDEEDSEEDGEDDKTFFGMGKGSDDEDGGKKGLQGIPPWEQPEPSSLTSNGGGSAVASSGAAGGGGAAGEAEPIAGNGTAGGAGGEDEDEADPLDAFMTGLKAPSVTQDNMSAAFGAGDMTSAAAANNAASGGAPDVSGILGNTISLDEIMRATKTNETWESDVMESESDVGGSEEEDYGKAFDLADDDDDDGDKEDETEPSDGEYVIPIRPIRKVKRKNGRKYYPPSEFVPADVGPDGKVVVPVKAESSFKETAEERRKREAEEEREELERKEFMENFRKAREEEEANRAVKAAKKQQEDDVAEEDARRKEEKLGRVFAGEGDVMEEYERDKVEQDALQLLQDSMKKKELKPVDHSKISYISLRKNLYIIPKALAMASEEKKENDRLELEIKVRGKGCPPVLHSWEQCGFSDRVLAVIRRNNFEKPFAIQKQAMPALMSGRDVIGVASTGSGKTLAFLLPLLRHIFDQPVLGEGEGPIGLIMAPARELAVQIYNEARKFTKALGLRVTAVYGGAGVADQIADLKRGAEIVVCTPGRMIDILTMQAGKLVSLDRVSFVVLDEADRMFDMGFEPQIKMILQNVRPDRQTALFSATFPRTVETLAKRVLKMPLEIIVGGRSIASSDITQHVEIRDDDDKFMRLLQLLGVWYEKGNILVFVDTQSKCDTLFQDLSRAGYHGLSLHGGKDQTDRDFTIADFKNKSATLMVATSVAGRGLDVPDLVCVINYSCPNHLEDYVHRVGRTGRAGRKGTAYTFISAEEEKHAPTLIKALTQSKQKIPPELVKMAEEFQGKVDSGQARKASSGFSGKGFTFDDSEQSESQQMRSLEKRQYEIEQGLRDPSELLGGKEKGEEGDEGDEEESEASKAARAENLTKAAITAASKLLKSTDEVERMKGAAMMTAAKLGLAVPRPEPGGEGKDGKPKTPQEALKEAAAIALRYFSPDGKGADSEPTHFTDKIVINDFPQQARWKITQKSTVNEVYEMTGVAIITKGMYIGNNQKPKEGEEKLHLVIEGKSDIDVQAGISEIRRILNEETMKVASSSSFSSGKYSVI